MYCEETADILDDNECRAATHVFIYTHTPSTADSLRPRDGTQCLGVMNRGSETQLQVAESLNYLI